MWNLKNFKDMLGYIQSRPLSSCNSIKTVGFSTLYTTISHCKLKDRLKELVQLCFIKTNGQRRYKYPVLGRDRSYFGKIKTTLILRKSSLKLISSICSSFWLTRYLLCLVDVFFKTVIISMGTNCAPLLADLFLYSYEADFIQGLRKKNQKELVRSFNFTLKDPNEVD